MEEVEEDEKVVVSFSECACASGGAGGRAHTIEPLKFCWVSWALPRYSWVRLGHLGDWGVHRLPISIPSPR